MDNLDFNGGDCLFAYLLSKKMKKLLKKILDTKYLILTAFVLILAAFVFSKTVWGQVPMTTQAPSAFGDVNYPITRRSTWFTKSQEEWDQIITNAFQTGQSSQEPFILSIFTGIEHSILNSTSGVKTLAYDQNGKPYYTYQGGAIQAIADLTGSLYTTPPASSVEYLADLGNSLGLVKPAYAQGIGFSAFRPLLDLWKKFRDLTYLAFVIIFVVIGFMVMFRKRIDPRTVVTIQEALPRIVITLILVTFSYAIVGLFVDLMQVVNYLLMTIFFDTPTGSALTPGMITDFFGNNIFRLIWGFSGPVFTLGDTIGKDIEIQLGVLGALFGSLTVQIVFNIGLFYLMFKVFFMLLGSYVGIILGVILAPLQILIKSLPGQNNNPMSFLSDLLANILVFPATLVMLLIAYKFILAGSTVGQFKGTPWEFMGVGGFSPSAGNKLTWAPPMMGFTQGLGIFIGYGILMAIPAIGDTIKQSLQVKPSPLAGEAEKGIRGGISWVPFLGGLAR